jgi:hypothetical protein
MVLSLREVRVPFAGQLSTWAHKGHAAAGEVAMGPVRTITELLLDPVATAITGWSESPTILQARAPASPPAPRWGAPPGRGLRGLDWFLSLGLVGLVMLLTGLIWDAGLHAQNPGLAHEEGVFTLSNPGHLSLFAGLITVAVGMVGAAWIRLGLGTDPRRSRRVRCLLLLSVVYLASLSVVALNRAAGSESAGLGQGTGHAHAVGSEEAGAGRAHAAGHDQAGEGGAREEAGHQEAGARQHATGPCRPTQAQSRAARKLVADTRGGLARFADLRDALAAGYAPHRRVAEAFKHYFNPAYVTDGRVLDPTRPEGLLYAHTERGPVVVAAVYLMSRAGEPGEAVGGCLTQWHVHDDLCSSDPGNGMITGVRTRKGRCPPGQIAWAAPPMLHTWRIDIPGGPFAHRFTGGAVFRQLRAALRRSTG